MGIDLGLNFNAYAAYVGQQLSAANSPFDTFNGTTKPTWVDLGSGRIALQADVGTTTQQNVYKAIGGTTTGGVCFAFRLILRRVASAVGYIAEVRTSTGILRLMLDTSRRLYLSNGSVNIGATSPALALDTEYIVRVSMKQNTGSGDSLARLKVSSVDDATTVHTVDVTTASIATGAVTYLAVLKLTTAQDLKAQITDLHIVSDTYAWVDPTSHTVPPTLTLTKIQDNAYTALSSAAGAGGTLAFTVAYKSGANHAASIVEPADGIFIFPQDAAASSTYTVTVTESPSGLTASADVVIPPAAAPVDSLIWEAWDSTANAGVGAWV